MKKRDTSLSDLLTKRLILDMRRILFPVNVKKLREFYRGYNGVVALIDYLDLPEVRALDLTEIGSSTIDLDGVLDDETMTEAETAYAIFFKTYKMYIGSKDGSVTPLEWLEKLSKVFSKIHPVARGRFDRICGALAAVNKAVHRALETGDYEIVTDEMMEEEDRKALEEEIQVRH
ncbi:MAG: hypothetical protein HYT93_04560 [Parcubacteria group bacterium]|nr:hypothetical protein [Parcubacteria group bacterium]